MIQKKKCTSDNFNLILSILFIFPSKTFEVFPFLNSRFTLQAMTVESFCLASLFRLFTAVITFTIQTKKFFYKSRVSMSCLFLRRSKLSRYKRRNSFTNLEFRCHVLSCEEVSHLSIYSIAFCASRCSRLHPIILSMFHFRAYFYLIV